MFQNILDYRQDTTNTRINAEHLLSKIKKDEFHELSELKYDLEVYFPILWERILDALPTELRPKLNCENRYSLIPEDKITEDAILKNFRGNLLNSIDNAGILYKELARRTYLTKKTIENYLYGERTPGINDVIDIAYALDVDLEYLLGLDNRGTYPILDTLESKFLNLFKALKYAGFRIRQDSNHLKVAYSNNPYIYQFFRSKINSIKDAYKIIHSEGIDAINLRVIRGKFVLYNPRIEKDYLEKMRFNIANGFYGRNTDD